MSGPVITSADRVAAIKRLLAELAKPTGDVGLTYRFDSWSPGRGEYCCSAEWLHGERWRRVICSGFPSSVLAERALYGALQAVLGGQP